MKSGRGASLLNIYVITVQQRSICLRQHPWESIWYYAFLIQVNSVWIPF